MDLSQLCSLKLNAQGSEWSETHDVWKDPRSFLSLFPLISQSHMLQEVYKAPGIQDYLAENVLVTPCIHCPLSIHVHL